MIIICVALCAVIKLTIQGHISRYSVKNVRDIYTLNLYISLGIAILMTALFVREFPPLQIFIYAILLAIFSLMCQFFYSLAFRCGPISLTVVIVTFNVFIPTLAGAFLYSEHLSIANIVGLVFMAISFVLVPKNDGGKAEKTKSAKKWLLFTILALIGAGMDGVVSHNFAKSYWASANKVFVTISFWIEAAVCLLISLLCKKKFENNIILNKKSVFLMFGMCCAMGINMILSTQALKTIPGSVYFPTQNLLVILLTLFTDIILFKEKISKRQMVGIVGAAISVVLLNG